MTCPECGWRIHGRAHFCPNCGIELPKPEETFLCPHCQAGLDRLSLLCPACGHPVVDGRKASSSRWWALLALSGWVFFASFFLSALATALLVFGKEGRLHV